MLEATIEPLLYQNVGPDSGDMGGDKGEAPSSLPIGQDGSGVLKTQHVPRPAEAAPMRPGGLMLLGPGGGAHVGTEAEASSDFLSSSPPIDIDFTSPLYASRADGDGGALSLDEMSPDRARLNQSMSASEASLSTEPGNSEEEQEEKEEREEEEEEEEEEELYKDLGLIAEEALASEA